MNHGMKALGDGCASSCSACKFDLRLQAEQFESDRSGKLTPMFDRLFIRS